MDRQYKKSLATECRHIITIQEYGATTDGEGGFTNSWSDVGDYWAAVYPIRASQREKYKAINVDAEFIFKVRGYTTLHEKNRIKFDSRYFEVLTVENIQERDFEQVAICRELRDPSETP